MILKQFCHQTNREMVLSRAKDETVSFYPDKVGFEFSGDVWARAGQQVAHESLVKRRLFSDDCSDHSQIILR